MFKLKFTINYFAILKVLKYHTLNSNFSVEEKIKVPKFLDFYSTTNGTVGILFQIVPEILKLGNFIINYPFRALKNNKLTSKFLDSSRKTIQK